jgi:osmoprotectant transport system ATP-binding protein
MGDRIAVMKAGGVLAQYATPAELLSAPADAFVADFVGADRALKRLSLLRVRDVELAPPAATPDAPVIAGDRTVRDALSILLEAGVRQAPVVAEDTVVGMLSVDAIGRMLAADDVTTQRAAAGS